MRPTPTLILLALASASIAQSPTPPPSQPHTIVDFTSWNPSPAGANGFITSKGGHFLDEKGSRIRFVGVNATNLFPDHAQAEQSAAILHSLGVNLVRFRGLGVFLADHPDSIAPKLGSLDYYVDALARHGVYSDFDLTRSHLRRYYNVPSGPAPGGAGAGMTFGSPESDRLGSAFFDARRALARQKVLRELLEHTNAVTKRRYADEPALMGVEVGAGLSLVSAAWTDEFDELGGEQLIPAMRGWNAWLKAKYPTMEALKAAWSAEDKPFGPNVLRNADFSRGAVGWDLERDSGAVASIDLPDGVTGPPGVAGKVLVVSPMPSQKQPVTVAIVQRGIDLVEGEPYTLSFWARADSPVTLHTNATVDNGDHHGIGLSGTVVAVTDWSRFDVAFVSSRTSKDHNRVSIETGVNKGAISLAGIQLRPGMRTTLPEGADPSKSNIPFQHPNSTPAARDWLAFLVKTERTQATALRDFVKKDLGSHANVSGGPVDDGGLASAVREAPFDFAHGEIGYTRHAPSQAGTNANDGLLVMDPTGGQLTRLAESRLAGRPFVVSVESYGTANGPTEIAPMVVAFAAVQDWDAIILPTEGSQEWSALYPAEKTDQATSSFLPAASAIFVRRDMALAFNEDRLKAPIESVVDLLSANGTSLDPEWMAAGIVRTQSISTRFSLAFTPGKTPPPIKPPDSSARHPEDDIINPGGDHGPIVWTTGGDRPSFTADSPSSKVIVGVIAGQPAQVPGLVANLEGDATDCESVTLTALDGLPTERSRLLLLTIANGTRGVNGAPTKLSGSVTIRTVNQHVNVHALDRNGKRTEKVDSKLAAGGLTFGLAADAPSCWYLIETGDVTAGTADH